MDTAHWGDQSVYLKAIHEIERAISGLFKRKNFLNKLCHEIKKKLGFEYVTIQLINREEHIIETIEGLGLGENWVGLARHYLEEERSLRDIQADIALSKNTEIISGWDDRFDPWIYYELQQGTISRITTPIILVSDENGNLIDNWWERCYEWEIVSDERTASFKLTEQSLEKLRREVVPENLLENLKLIENQEVKGEKEFLDAVKTRIGEEQTVRYEELILKHAEKTKRQHTILKLVPQKKQPRLTIDVIGTVGAGFPIANKIIPAPDAVSLNKFLAGKAGEIREFLLPYVLQTIVEHARQVVNADSASLHFLYAPCSNSYVYEVCSGNINISFLKDCCPSDDGLEQQAIETGEPNFFPAPNHHESDSYNIGINPKKRSIGIKAQAVFPLKVGEKEGVLYIYFHQQHRFSHYEIGWLKFFANRVVAAIEHATTYTQLHNMTNQLSSLHKISQSLVEKTPFGKKLLPFIANSARNLLAADVVVIYEYSESTQEFKVSPEIAGKLIDKEAIINENITEQSIPALLVKRRENIYSESISQEPIFSALGREKIKSMAGILLSVGKKEDVLGLMLIAYRRPHSFAGDEKEIIETLASSAAIAIKNTRLYDYVNKRREALVKIGQKLTEGIRLHEDEVLNLIYKQATRMLGMKNLSIALYNEPTDTVKFVLAVVKGNRVKNIEENPGWGPRKGWHGKTERVIQSRKYWWLKTQKEVNEAGFSSTPGHKDSKGRFVSSWIGVPMIANKKVLGIIANYEYGQDNFFDDDDVEILQALADQAAIAIDNARLYDRLKDVNQKRKVLVEIGQRLTAGIHLNENEVLELIYQQASEMLGMNSLTIALYDEKIDTVRFALGTVNGKRVRVEKEPGWGPRQGGNGKTERIIHSKQHLLLPTQEKIKEVGFSPIPGHKDYEGTLPNSWLGVPMIVGDKVLGVIANYDYGQDNVYDEDDIEILQALADQAAIALENVHLYNSLKEREDQYRTLVEQVNDGIFIVQKGIVKSAYGHLIKMGGKTAEEMLGTRFTDHLRDDKRKEAIDRYNRRITGGNVGPTYETILKLKDGSDLYAEVSSTLISYQGKPADFIVIRNITKRKQAEEALQNALDGLEQRVQERTEELRESEQRLSDIINFLPDATFVIDRDGKVITWNRAIETMTGVKAEDILGKGNYEYSIPLYGKRRRILIDLVRKRDEKFEKEHYDRPEIQGNTLAAENYLPYLKIYVYGKASPLYDHQGNVVGAISTVRDITDRKQAEERLKKLHQLGQKLNSTIQLSENQILKLIYDNASGIMDTSNMYIVCYDEESDEIRFPLAFRNSERIHLATRKAENGYIKEIISSPPTETEVRYKDNIPDKTEFSWNVGLMNIGEIGERVLGAIVTYNIGKEKAYNKDDIEILQSIADLAAIALENANLYEKAKEEVIATKQLSTLGIVFGAIQHRISNTLDIVTPNVRRLRNHIDSTDKDVNEILDIIERNVKYTSDIIAHLQEPLKQTEAQMVDINLILKETAQKVDTQWQIDSSHPEIKVNFTLDNSLPFIRVSSGLIAEVFHNLFDNAYRAMTKGDQLTVDSQKVEKMIEVRVQDTGSGISSEIQNRLFKKPVPSRKSGGGAGLGLWLNKLILQSLGGNIRIENSEATGTTILVEIPVAEKIEE